jgi:hypothetical protein
MKNSRETKTIELTKTIAAAKEALAIVAASEYPSSPVAVEAVTKVLRDAEAELADIDSVATEAELIAEARRRRADERNAKYAPEGETACPFCEGGYQPWNSHIRGGICFRCNGRGY